MWAVVVFGVVRASHVGSDILADTYQLPKVAGVPAVVQAVRKLLLSTLARFT